MDEEGQDDEAEAEVPEKKPSRAKASAGPAMKKGRGRKQDDGAEAEVPEKKPSKAKASAGPAKTKGRGKQP